MRSRRLTAWVGGLVLGASLCLLRPAHADCGDAVLDPGEVCDDGGTAWGDGCAGDCSWTDYPGFGSACASAVLFEDNGSDDDELDDDDEVLNGTEDDSDENTFYTNVEGVVLEILQIRNELRFYTLEDGEIFRTGNVESGLAFEEGGIQDADIAHTDGLPRLVFWAWKERVRFFATLTISSALQEVTPLFDIDPITWDEVATRVEYQVRAPFARGIELRYAPYTWCAPVEDQDGDFVPNSADGDDDSDGIPDRIDNQDKSASNADDDDDDGLINSRDLDSNNDGIPDLVACWGLASQGSRVGMVASPLDDDEDEDGIPDAYDASGGCGAGDDDTSPEDGICDRFQDGSDSDHDGYDDAADWDDDGDGIFDEGPADDFGCWQEDGAHRDTDGDGENDQLDLDLDEDSLPTVDELEGSLDLIGRRLDLDGADEDGNGLHDDIEASSFLADGDEDGIPDAFDPDDPDSDGDECNDEDECEDGWPCSFAEGYPDYMNAEISVCEVGPSGGGGASDDAFDGVRLGGGPSCGESQSAGVWWPLLVAGFMAAALRRRREPARAS